MRTSLSLRAFAVAAGTALLATVLGVSPAYADGEQVVATGLNNPRHLSFAPNGDLYIAESGAWSEGIPQTACIESDEFGNQCLNDSGSITLVSRKGSQTRVLTGLPAIVSPEEAVGPSAVALHGQTAYVVLGLGGDVAKRTAFGPSAAALGTLTSYPLTGKRAGSLVADLAAFESSDPDGAGVDSNPVGLSRDRDGWLLVDAGGNDVLRVGKARALTAVAVLPSGTAEAPPDLGLPPGTQIPVQSVPTAVQQGPDGAWYVAELTGFPFPVGGSTIWRIGADGAVTAYASGLTNVTDLAWSGTDLYAVQIADNGLLAGPTGSLVKVSTTGSHEAVAGPWFAPYGVAIKGSDAFVTTCSVCAGGGQVIKVPLG